MEVIDVPESDGEDIVQGKDGEPQQPRTPGRLAGKIRIAPDFDETPEDLIAAFEGDLDTRD